jgi:fructokinase
MKSLGAAIALVSRVGTDELGDAAISLLASHDLDTSFIQRDSTLPTGTVPVTFDALGNASYTITKNVAYDSIEITPPLLAAAKACQAFCFGTLVARAPLSRETLYTLIEAASSAVKVVDINLRQECFTHDTVLRSLELADIVKLNSDEVPKVCRLLGLSELSPAQFAKYTIKEFGLSHVLVTKGPDGMYGRSLLGEEVELPGIAVSVVDTIGSGDAFTAGFLSKLLAGRSFGEACDFGNKLGAAVECTKGGISPCRIPDPAAP